MMFHCGFTLCSPCDIGHAFWVYLSFSYRSVVVVKYPLSVSGWGSCGCSWLLLISHFLFIELEELRSFLHCIFFFPFRARGSKDRARSQRTLHSLQPSDFWGNYNSEILHSYVNRSMGLFTYFKLNTFATLR